METRWRNHFLRIKSNYKTKTIQLYQTYIHNYNILRKSEWGALSQAGSPLPAIPVAPVWSDALNSDATQQWLRSDGLTKMRWMRSVNGKKRKQKFVEELKLQKKKFLKDWKLNLLKKIFDIFSVWVCAVISFFGVWTSFGRWYRGLRYSYEWQQYPFGD